MQMTEESRIQLPFSGQRFEARETVCQYVQERGNVTYRQASPPNLAEIQELPREKAQGAGPRPAVRYGSSFVAEENNCGVLCLLSEV